MVKRFIKRNGVLIATLLTWAAAVVALAVGLDQFIYQKEKRDLFFGLTPEDLFPTDLGGLLALDEQWHARLMSGQDDSDLIEKLRVESRVVVHGPSAIFRVGAYRPDGSLIFEEISDKAASFNNSSNSLWVRRFTNQWVRQVGPPDAAGARHKLWIQFTTPNLPLAQLEREIERLKLSGSEANRAELKKVQSQYDRLKPIPGRVRDLTNRYRRITYYLAAALTVLTLVFLRRLVLPMRGVISAIEDSRPGATRFIRRPRTQLERLYNEMARHTVLARLRERQAARLQSGPPATGWELIEAACSELVDENAAALAACIELREEGPGRLRLSGRALVAEGRGRFGDLEEDQLLGCLEDALGGGTSGAAAAPGSFVWMAGRMPRHGRSIAAMRFADPERPGVHWGLALAIDPRGRAVDMQATEALLGRFAGLLSSGLEALVAHGRTLTRERDRASINLSRNLGHDLTNIIATSKLELMTLQELLRDGAPPVEGPRREILKESLDALLNSTRFLQETVNLYRAYAFLKEPVMEVLDANELVRETAGLFRLSTSQKVTIEERLDPAAPRCSADPRLLKLALFNLLSNAVDAIRRGPHGDGGAGVVTLATRATGDGSLEISVHDSGPGIRNERGEPAGPEEMEQIFALGWSAGRAPGEGEGLGLNWVRTIVVDLHGGRIMAENPPGGGARFRVILPRIGG